MFKQKLLTSIRKLTNRSDYRRWSDSHSLSSNWDSRTSLIATFIPEDSIVLEFGAGNMHLRQCLPVNCTYIPSDLIPRIPDTFVCDLNKKTLLTPPQHDVAIFSGVLEYVNDIPRLANLLANTSGLIITSYATTDNNPKDRRRHGWVNDYSQDELIGIFSAAGYHLTATETWRTQGIYVFAKTDQYTP